ncbi:DASH family cryptochrome [Vibrio alfacsensis]|uniref:DASH family cryptochrome n=1 Tax=Vibrio TaxID=662 RepID=UPI004068D849
MSIKVGLYWFTNDLRVHDNRLLQHASSEVEKLICLYCLPKITPFLAHFAQEREFGRVKRQFLEQSLHDLDKSLIGFGQRLFTTVWEPRVAIIHAIKQSGVTHLYVDAVPSSDEQSVIQTIRTQCPHICVVQHHNRSLFNIVQLPFTLDALPKTFTQFRIKTEKQKVKLPDEMVKSLPPPPPELDWLVLLSSDEESKSAWLKGGERAGLIHCERYFFSSLASQYKDTRNSLDGIDNSTKFSPWLAHGCISPRTIFAMLKHYECLNGANDSTYWIYFELLWREYFYWYARRYGKQLFQFAGIRNQPPLTTFYAHRFLQWKKGETPFPIVNACMHQLNETGYMSNRGRQLVASCLVHELGLDWRYGAAYFESQLIDYDVASNWGNWQYLAGVGADPRGSRQFNLEKQTQMYDPYMEFIDRWQGRCAGAQLDSVDMVDWPIVMESQEKTSS